MPVPPLGYRIEDEDHDWLETNAVKGTFSDSAEPPPDEIDVRSIIQLWNQLNMGSCSGHSGAHLSAYLNWIGSGGDSVQRFSRMWCYLRAQQASGYFGSDQGATITGLVKALMEHGVCLESSFPYPNQYNTAIPASATDSAAAHKILGHSTLRSYAQVFSWLSNKFGGVSIGIPWTAGIAQCTGVAELSARGGQNYGGHALAYMGYSKRKDRAGRNYLWLANSHGPSYGNRGWVEVAPDLVEYYCQQRTCETIGIMTLQTFDPDKLAVRM